MPSDGAHSERLRQRAEGVRESAEGHRDQAEQHRESTERRRRAAESARDEAEQFRCLAEEARALRDHRHNRFPAGIREHRHVDQTGPEVSHILGALLSRVLFCTDRSERQ